MTEANRKSAVSGSKPNQKKNSSQKPMDPNVPDQSYGDFYCPICDSHMNTYDVWKTHVIGKKHIKNVQKGEKNMRKNSKYEDLPNKESTVTYKLRYVKEPIIGLSYIQEVRRKEPNVPPIFNCFLCHANIATPALVVEHVVSMKHRMNYIKEKSPEEFHLIEGTNLKKESLEPLILEISSRMEKSDGRGSIKVKQERNKAKTTLKRHNDDDFDLRWKISKETELWLKGPNLHPVPRTPSFASLALEERSPTLKTFYDSDQESRNSFARYSSKRKLSPNRGDHDRSSKRCYRKNHYSQKSQKHVCKRHDQSSYAERVKTNSFRGLSSENYPSISSQSLPHERVKKMKSESEFDKFLREFPSDVFLKNVLAKLEEMQCKSLQELNLLSKVIIKAKEVLISQVPPELKAIINQKPYENNKQEVITKSTGVSPSSMSTLNQVEIQQNGEASTSNAVSSNNTSSLINNLLNSCGNLSCVSEERSHQPSTSEQPSAQINNSYSLTVSPSAILSNQNDTHTERSTLISIPGLTQPQQTCIDFQNHPSSMN